uniref:Uncharacterized protein n=1 Tax=Rhizophora mucronata TaxID=61149 RepID=A0A2P2N0I7_RHIMU
MSENLFSLFVSPTHLNFLIKRRS